MNRREFLFGAVASGTAAAMAKNGDKPVKKSAKKNPEKQPPVKPSGKLIVSAPVLQNAAATSIGVLLFLIEIGSPLISGGVHTQFGVNEIVHERGHVDELGVTLFRVGKFELYVLFLLIINFFRFI